MRWTGLGFIEWQMIMMLNSFKVRSNTLIDPIPFFFSFFLM